MVYNNGSINFYTNLGQLYEKNLPQEEQIEKSYSLEDEEKSLNGKERRRELNRQTCLEYRTNFRAYISKLEKDCMTLEEKTNSLRLQLKPLLPEENMQFIDTLFQEHFKKTHASSPSDNLNQKNTQVSLARDALNQKEQEALTSEQRINRRKEVNRLNAAKGRIKKKEHRINLELKHKTLEMSRKFLTHLLTLPLNNILNEEIKFLFETMEIRGTPVRHQDSCQNISTKDAKSPEEDPSIESSSLEATQQIPELLPQTPPSHILAKKKKYEYVEMTTSSDIHIYHSSIPVSNPSSASTETLSTSNLKFNDLIGVIRPKKRKEPENVHPRDRIIEEIETLKERAKTLEMELSNLKNNIPEEILFVFNTLYPFSPPEVEEKKIRNPWATLTKEERLKVKAASANKIYKKNKQSLINLKKKVDELEIQKKNLMNYLN